MTREQFTSHVEGIQKAFRRFLVALCCGNSSLADDIAQEALIKAYLSCDSFRDINKFNAWIWRIGYNTFISDRRAAKISVGYDSIMDRAAADSADSAFRYQALYAALNRIPDKERMAILLHYMEGYSVKEIADIIDASQDAVRQQLSRGRNHLRSVLDLDAV